MPRLGYRKPFKKIGSVQSYNQIEGYLIIPKSNFFNNQKLIMIKKSNKNYIKKELFDVKFVPLLKEKKIF